MVVARVSVSCYHIDVMMKVLRAIQARYIIMWRHEIKEEEKNDVLPKDRVRMIHRHSGPINTGSTHSRLS